MVISDRVGPSGFMSTNGSATSRESKMQMKTLRAVLAICALGVCVTAPGCSVIVDGAIQDRDAGNGGGIDGGDRDASGGGDSGGGDGGGGIISCTGMTDGTMCGGGRVCINEACEISECGDGVIDPALGEECDDENDVPGDGCENDCDLTCENAADCDDGRPCNGAETCSDDNVCVAGTPLGSGASCEQASGEAGVCREADCVRAGCGNTIVDAGEACDDGNTDDGDGCDSDCTFSCETDSDCDDGSVCTGSETCDTANHVCVAGTLLECEDSSPCTRDECDSVMGCVYPLVDMDGDGYASSNLGACGTDCNDSRADVNPGAVELCGDALDSDCNGEVNPASTPFWYLDCDDDGYSFVGAATQQLCEEPPPACTGGTGGWTTRVPISGDRSTNDCRDTNALVRPNQTTYQSTAIPGASSSIDFDYDCDMSEKRRWTTTGVSLTASCASFRGLCIGSSGWTGAIAPVCGVAAEFSACELDRTGACTRTRIASRTQQCL
jgi:cysteine-rich repeat protein